MLELRALLQAALADKQPATLRGAPPAESAESRELRDIEHEIAKLTSLSKVRGAGEAAVRGIF